MEIDDLESRVLVQARCLAALEGDTKRIVWSFGWILELEELLLVVAKVLEQDNLLVSFYDCVVSLGPSSVAVLVARSQVANDPSTLVTSGLGRRQLSVQISQ